SNWRGNRFLRRGKVRSVQTLWLAFGLLLTASTPTGLLCSAAREQQNSSTPVVVQPGAPGKPSRRLPSATGKLPPRSEADVEFMQGMIMHHSQAVEMTALIASHTENQDLRSLGARIS